MLLAFSVLGGILIWQKENLKLDWKGILKIKSWVILSLIFSFVIIYVVIKFPFPLQSRSISTIAITERFTESSGEAAISSRWSLLPNLFSAIKASPVLGSGLGKTITYKSSDPRILENNPNGRYTTYAFEWGWLEIWLKFGLFGVLIYFWLLAMVVCDGLKMFIFRKSEAKFNIFSLILGIIFLFFVNIFSPYFNHPLGIGYLIFVSRYVDLHKK